MPNATRIFFGQIQTDANGHSRENPCHALKSLQTRFFGTHVAVLVHRDGALSVFEFELRCLLQAPSTAGGSAGVPSNTEQRKKWQDHLHRTRVSCYPPGTIEPDTCMQHRLVAPNPGTETPDARERCLEGGAPLQGFQASPSAYGAPDWCPKKSNSTKRHTNASDHGLQEEDARHPPRFPF